MGSSSSKHRRDSAAPASPDDRVIRAKSPAEAPSRALFPPADGDRKKDRKAKQEPPTWSLEDICNPANTRRAETLKRLEDSDADERFGKYRNYFKNHDLELARAIQSMVTKASKPELREWVHSHVGELEFADEYAKLELVEIAMVSACLTKYGERALVKLDKAGKLDNLPNVALITHNLRLTSQQQACRAQSKATDKKGKEAAHYVGLEVMMKLNERLPVEQRMGDELREILNHPSNLRLVSRAANQSLHKRVDAVLIAAGGEGAKEVKLSSSEYTRLVQIAKHAQGDVFQDAMASATNGQYLYRSLRNQFQLVDIGDRAPVWDDALDRILRGEAGKAVASDVSKEMEAQPPLHTGEKVVAKVKAVIRHIKPHRSHKPPVVVATKSRSSPRPAEHAPDTTTKPVSAPKKTRAKAAKPAKKKKAPARQQADKENVDPNVTPSPAKKQPGKRTAKAPSRRVTRSRGVAEHVELSDSFIDDEYVNDSDDEEWTP